MPQSSEEVMAMNKSLLSLVKSLEGTIEGLESTIKELRAEVSPLRSEQPKSFEGKDNSSSGKSEKKTKKTPDTDTQNEDGWIPVKFSKKKAGEEKMQVPLQLRPNDWSVPIIEPCDFKDGASGVAMVSNKVREQLAKEVSQCSGQMAVITNKEISNKPSRAIEVKALTKEGRLVRLDRCLTNVGDKEVKAHYETKKEVNECTMHVPNNTCRIVIQLQGRFCSLEQFKNAKEAPKAAFYTWTKLVALEGEFLYLTNPFLKQVGDHEWLEAIATIRSTSLYRFLDVSGKYEFLTKVFLTKDMPDATNLKVAWFNPGMNIKDALSMASRFEGIAKGIACGKRGLKIRVPEEKLENRAGEDSRSNRGSQRTQEAESSRIRNF